MSTTITCYGGINEIGGNKILVEDGEIRVFLDFGRPFGRYSYYFDGIFVRERTIRGLLDAIALGLLPPLEGLYRDDLVPIFNSTYLIMQEEDIDRGGHRKTRRYVKCNRYAAYDDFWKRFRSSPCYQDMRRDGPAVDAIVLSHAHLDHSGDLSFVRHDIPVFSSLMTAFIAKAMQDSSKPGTSGAVYFNPYTVKENGLLSADRSRGFVWRQWCFLDGEPKGEENESDPFASAWSFWVWRPQKQDQPASEVKTYGEPAPLNLRWWPLDHSIFGANGFVMETNAGLIAYTGDIRFHGRNRDLSHRFMEELSALHIHTLLCEGTYAGIGEHVTEDEVRDKCLAAVRAAEGKLVIADFAPRNIERLISFLDIARETGRPLLIQPKDAYLLSAMNLAEPDSVPDPKRERYLAVYDDPKGQQYKWEQITRQLYKDRLLGPNEVKANPGDYILAFSLWDMADLLDIEHILGGTPGGVYIYSNSKAYDEEQKMDLVRLWNWICHFGMEPVGLRAVARDRTGRVIEVDVEPGYHASGHADESDLLRFVKAVRPKMLIPIHTERPEWWEEKLRGTGIQVEIPTYAHPVHPV